MSICCLFSVLISFINCYSVKLATKVQNFFTVTKLIAIAIITVGGAVMISKGKLLWSENLNGDGQQLH
jgi:amino acid transporter